LFVSFVSFLPSCTYFSTSQDNLKQNDSRGRFELLRCLLARLREHVGGPPSPSNNKQGPDVGDLTSDADKVTVFVDADLLDNLTATQ